jgi:hypothetical protein
MAGPQKSKKYVDPFASGQTNMWDAYIDKLKLMTEDIEGIKAFEEDNTIARVNRDKRMGKQTDKAEKADIDQYAKDVAMKARVKRGQRHMKVAYPLGGMGAIPVTSDRNRTTTISRMIEGGEEYEADKKFYNEGRARQKAKKDKAEEAGKALAAVRRLVRNK